MGIREDQKGPRISQSTELRPERRQSDPRVFAPVCSATLVIFFFARIHERLYKPTHVSRVFAVLSLLIPQLPALCPLELFLAAWSPGLGGGVDENIGAACHGPGLWLQTGRPAGEAARLNAILLLACFPSAASPENLGPVSEVRSLPARGPGHTAPTVHSLNVHDRWATQSLCMSWILRGKQQMKATESCLSRLLHPAAVHCNGFLTGLPFCSSSLAPPTPSPHHANFITSMIPL